VRWFVVGALVILAYDALLALGSRLFGYVYGGWWPGILGSVAILAASGFLAGRETGTTRAGMMAAAGVMVVDVLVGWPISGVIVPGYFPTGSPGDVVSAVAGVAILGAAFGAAIGFVASWLGSRTRKPRATPTS
jgi:hypothetical protein